jgi:hypothetical protein
MGKQFRPGNFLIISLIVVLAGMRLLFPEADPSWLKATDDSFDETWWAENARQQILFHRWMGDDYAGAMAVSPISTGIFFLIFKAFGIHFFSLRLMGLIPAILAILLLAFRKAGKPENERINQFMALLLASSPTLFVWSKIGQLESLLGFILIVVVLTGRKPGIRAVILAGIIAAIGIQVKASFTLFIIPLGIWCSQLDDEFNRKRAFGFILGFSVTTLVFYLGYYLPNLEKFKVYYEAIQNRSIPATVLLDPRGWPLRIGWLTTKDFLCEPVTLFSTLLLLIRYAVNRIPVHKFSFTSFLLLCFLVTLFSDFSERRFIPLLFIMPFALMEETKPGNANKWGLIAGSFILLLGLLPVFPKFNWFVSPNSVGFNRDFETMYPLLILLLILCSLLYVFSLKYRKLNLPNMLFMLSALVWASRCCHGISLRFGPLTGISKDFIFYGISGICVIMGVLLGRSLLSESENFNSLFGKFLRITLFTGSILCISCLIRPSWNLRTAAEYLAINGKAGETSIGPPSSFSLTFLSLVTPHHYLDLELNPKNRSTDSTIHWYCAISTPSCRAECIESELQGVLNRFDTYSNSTYRKAAYPSFTGYREMVFIHKFDQKLHLCE